MCPGHETAGCGHPPATGATRREIRPFLGAISYYTNVDLDTFHELSLARETWALGGVPKHDLYAYTPTLPRVVHHEWGTGMVLYAASVASGLGGAGLLLLKHLLALGMA